MCANPKSIREIMIAAEELKMIDNGEYVFFNIEIFGSLTKETKVRERRDIPRIVFNPSILKALVRRQ